MALVQENYKAEEDMTQSYEALKAKDTQGFDEIYGNAKIETSYKTPSESLVEV